MSSKATVTIKKSTAYIIGAVVILALVGTYLGTSYITKNNGNNSGSTMTTTDNGADKASLKKYEGTSLEDKSALANTISALPGGKNIDNIEPHTEKQPFGLKLHGTDQLTAEQIEQLSKQLLSIVKDCEWVEINSNQFHAKTTKEGLQEFSVVN